MRHFFILLLTTLFVACDDVYALPELPDGQEYKHIKICVLGNSYSADAFSYVPFILLNYGITSEVYMYYRGSGSLKDLDEQWEDDSDYGLADGDGKKHVRRFVYVDTRHMSQWNFGPIQSAKDILSKDQWDMIVLQQYSAHTDSIQKYYPYLYSIADKIEQAGQDRSKISWLMAYNRASHDYIEGNIETQRQVVEDFPFYMVMPVATAIFSARANSELAELGDYKKKNLWASDGIHLQEGLPCYIAALTVVQTLLDKFDNGKSVIGDSVRPTADWISTINGIFQNGVSVGIDEENCLLAQLYAVAANEHPFEIVAEDIVTNVPLRYGTQRKIRHGSDAVNVGGVKSMPLIRGVYISDGKKYISK